MKKHIGLISITTLALALSFAGHTIAGPEQDDDVSQGTMRVIPPKGEESVDLPLKHTEVTAEISGFVTRVKVVQTFTNPYKDPIEAIYVFPLPQNAAVGDMQIRIADRIIKGVIKKRAEAKQIYEAAKQAGKTAALLEQERPNIFSQSVANIMPGSDILVEITYDEVLTYENGGYEFSFPMVVGPRFIPGAATGKQGGGWSPDTDQVPDASRITPPVLKPGERSGHDINLTVKLNAGVPIQSFECPSHRTLISPVTAAGGVIDGPCEIRLESRDTIPNKDFVLRYRVAGQKPQMASLAFHGQLGGYFMLMFQPPELRDTTPVTPKEMVFVMDCSGSMSGEPISLAKKAVRYALENLNSNDTFQIIRFSESASPFAQEPLLATQENIRRGLSYVNGLKGEGGTMMIEGIKASLDYPHRDNRLRIVCFMTDGYIGNEAEILQAIKDRIGDDTRLFSFGVGSSVNRYLLERMGEVGRGEVQYVLLNEKPDEAVNKFYERVRNPVLTHIRVDWAGLDVSELYPARIRDLFAGQPIFVLGRYNQPGKANIKVHGKIGGLDMVFSVPVDLPAGNDQNAALAPLWARARIRELEGEQYRGSNKDVEKAITDLALEYRLMSAYTSFVAVEEKVVNEGGQVKTVQVPVEMPDGVSYDGVFGRDTTDECKLQPMPASAHGSPLVMKGLFAGRSKKSADAAVAVQMLPNPQELREEATEQDKPLPAFVVTLSQQRGQETDILSITPTGELWKETRDASGAVTSKMLAGRLTRVQARTLLDLITAALNEKLTTVSSVSSGTLSVKLMDDQGATTQEATLQLAPQGGAESVAWTKVLEYLRSLTI